MKLLAENKKLGNVVRYCQNILQINIKTAGVSLYFENEAFLTLVDLLEQAKRNIICEQIEGLLCDTQKEDNT